MGETAKDISVANSFSFERSFVDTDDEGDKDHALSLHLQLVDEVRREQIHFENEALETELKGEAFYLVHHFTGREIEFVPSVRQLVEDQEKVTVIKDTGSPKMVQSRMRFHRSSFGVSVGAIHRQYKRDYVHSIAPTVSSTPPRKPLELALEDIASGYSRKNERDFFYKHWSHLSLQLLVVCADAKKSGLNIQLVCLPSGQTARLQPFDKAVFGGVKARWRQHLQKLHTSVMANPKGKLIISSRKERFPCQLRIFLPHLKMALLNCRLTGPLLKSILQRESSRVMMSASVATKPAHENDGAALTWWSHAPTPKFILLGLLSFLNASVTPRIASAVQARPKKSPKNEIIICLFPLELLVNLLVLLPLQPIVLRIGLRPAAPKQPMIPPLEALAEADGGRSSRLLLSVYSGDYPLETHTKRRPFECDEDEDEEDDRGVNSFCLPFFLPLACKHKTHELCRPGGSVRSTVHEAVKTARRRGSYTGQRHEEGVKRQGGRRKSQRRRCQLTCKITLSVSTIPGGVGESNFNIHQQLKSETPRTSRHGMWAINRRGYRTESDAGTGKWDENVNNAGGGGRANTDTFPFTCKFLPQNVKYPGMDD
ncbi:hypothetical protein BV898_10896 [Hypsibius exemplaris]|uniref:DDE-1 domain-containing protein n=1 Tax=Hypsibius exemplaris TaxID=2072580 RepID=A0A1W0WI29_HYPEX|nr:hypothetical protein BV898_10896 [Hypsibius exemplaris]